MEKFQNKYRIPSARWQNWNYRLDGAYFITICTNGREPHFGNIENGIMHLSEAGILADVFWHEIIHHAKNVELGEFIVMPNHIHGILILNGNNPDHDDETVVDVGTVDINQSPKKQPAQPQPPIKTLAQQRFQNIGKNSVSSIIGSYKSAVTKHAHRLGFVMGWQKRFHDHVIRNDDEYQRIANYIMVNPQNWDNDKFHNPPIGTELPD